MPNFSFAGKDQDGRRVYGTLESNSLVEAEAELGRKHPIIYRVEEQSNDTKIVKLLTTLAPIQLEELVGLSEAMATMADGGISLKRTIDILEEDTENAALKRLLGDISEDVGGGRTLSQALARHTSVFPRYYVAMVAAGESSGNLPEMLRRLASILTAMEAMQARARAALSYPITLFAFTFASFLFFFAYGSPYLEKIYASLQVAPPTITRILIGLGVTMAQNTFGIVILVGLAVVLGVLLLNRPGGRIVTDRIRLSIPFLGHIYRVLYTSRFLRTMSVLYRSGLGLAPSVRLAAATVGNEVVTEELFDLSQRLDKGEELSNVLRSSVHVSRLAVGMIAAGEEAGKLEKMLVSVSDVYDVKSETLLQGLRSRLEPVVMLLLGGSVAILLIALGWPLLSVVA